MKLEDLPDTQRQTLTTLSESDKPMYGAEIAHKANRNPDGVHGQLMSLAKKGFVTRLDQSTARGNDLRYYSISDKGRRLLNGEVISIPPVQHHHKPKPSTKSDRPFYPIPHIPAITSNLHTATAVAPETPNATAALSALMKSIQNMQVLKAFATTEEVREFLQRVHVAQDILNGHK